MPSALAYMAYKTLDLLQPLLFPYPKNSHVQTPLCSFPLLVYSHRGGALESQRLTENTMGAFENSARLKVHVLELDVQLTKDKHVVVFHDNQLGRMAGPAYKNKAIKDFNLRDLPPLIIKTPPTTAPVTPDAPLSTVLAADKPSVPATPVPPDQALEIRERQGLPALGDQTPGMNEALGEEGPPRIPLLSEILTSFPDFPIQIDIKVNTPGIVDAVHELVMSQPQRQHKLLWGSFKHQVQTDMYEKNSHIPLFTSGWRAIYLRLAHAVGRMDKVHIYESATIVPWRMRVLWGSAKHWYPFLERSWCEALAKRGVSVIYFGLDLNGWDGYRASIQAGGNAICTDRPAYLQAFLRQHSSKSAAEQSHANGNGNKYVNGYTSEVNGSHGHGLGNGNGERPEEMLQPLQVNVQGLCQHTGSGAVLPCAVCSTVGNAVNVK